MWFVSACQPQWLSMGQQYNEKVFPIHTPSISHGALVHFGPNSWKQNQLLGTVSARVISEDKSTRTLSNLILFVIAEMFSLKLDQLLLHLLRSTVPHLMWVPMKVGKEGRHWVAIRQVHVDGQYITNHYGQVWDSNTLKKHFLFTHDPSYMVCCGVLVHFGHL